MTEIQRIAFIAIRGFTASVWYGAEFFPGRFALYAKTRELIAGDRAQVICQKVIDEERYNGQSPAERKATQRKRQRSAGMVTPQWQIEAEEHEMIKRNCALRRPGREPYDEAEYIQMLIRNDDARLKRDIAELSQCRCGKCGEVLPVAECCLSGDAECWNTRGWHEMKLKVE